MKLIWRAIYGCRKIKPQNKAQPGSKSSDAQRNQVLRDSLVGACLLEKEEGFMYAAAHSATLNPVPLPGAVDEGGASPAKTN
ncbi:hypothetical protein [Desulfosarcina sp.]|uniref:hypothetical protein n=1 Tax=Desulfosarcina sp. TaxID=2027861 RepID=UPI0039708F0F